MVGAEKGARSQLVDSEPSRRVQHEESVASLTEKAHHYEESLQMIERTRPARPIVGALHAELDRLVREPPEAAHAMAL